MVAVAGDSTDAALGGLVGAAFAFIENSYATGTVTGGMSNERLGGLVGSMMRRTSSIANSYATGMVSGGGGSDRIGGLAGSASGSYYNHQ